VEGAKKSIIPLPCLFEETLAIASKEIESDTLFWSPKMGQPQVHDVWVPSDKTRQHPWHLQL